METRKTPLLSDSFYHVYNRGINGQPIFFEERNYSFFLQKMVQYISPFMDVYAYCLLGNHFHLLVKTKPELQIPKLMSSSGEMAPLNPALKSPSWHYSNAFASLFKSYAQAINKNYGRRGGLFEEPFHRIQVKSDTYFSQLICYIHLNPQKHGFVKDFRDYPHSSYHSHLHQKATKLQRAEVLNWFGNSTEYTTYHMLQKNENGIQDLIIEFD